MVHQQHIIKKVLDPQSRKLLFSCLGGLNVLPLSWILTPRRVAQDDGLWSTVLLKSASSFYFDSDLLFKDPVKNPILNKDSVKNSVLNKKLIYQCFYTLFQSKFFLALRHPETALSGREDPAKGVEAQLSETLFYSYFGGLNIMPLRAFLSEGFLKLVANSIIALIVSGVFSLSAVESDQKPVVITTLRDFVLAQDKQGETAQKLAVQEAAKFSEDGLDHKRYQAVIGQLNLLELETAIPDIVAAKTQKFTAKK